MKINEVITEAGFLKGVAKAIVPNTVADWDKTKNALYPLTLDPTDQPATKKSQPKLPSIVTTPTGIKVKKDPANGKWIRQDNNQIVSDPREIQRLEQLAKNAQQVNIARGTQTR
jgi:hypothetical protein